jgi:hypothetical protein
MSIPMGRACSFPVVRERPCDYRVIMDDLLLFVVWFGPTPDSSADASLSSEQHWYKR